MPKTSFKEYLDYLYLKQEEFSKEYRIYIDKKFDPRKYLDAVYYPYKPYVNAVLNISEDFLHSIIDLLGKKINNIVFDFIVYTSGKDEKYNFKIKYSYIEKKGYLYPESYSHECPFLKYHNDYIACKHLYAVLREIDKIAENNKDIPIVKSFFIPKSSNLLKEYGKIKESDLDAIEKLKKTFEILEEHLYLKELKYLEILNLRLKYLKRF
ncbi:MAG: hypothetical protein QXL14_03655 [Candidatus Aenigmatarchaeota archaeon]